MPRARQATITIASILAIIAIIGALAYWLSRPPLPSWRGVDFGLDGTAASVFAPDKLLVFDLQVEPHDLQRMRDEARDEVAVPARLEVGDLNVGMVLLRYKGSTGTLNSVLDERQTESYMPKLSLKIVFDKVVSEQRFCGLRRLNFHSMIYDESLMRDRLCYQAFREAGIVAPRCTHAMIVVNDENLGIYAMVEQIDDSFVMDRFGETSHGLLYKEVWPVSQNPESYAREQRWNPSQLDHTAMLALAKALSQAPASELPSLVAQHANLDELLRYFIVDQALKNWDGVRGWTSRTATSTAWNHNYYWYVSPQQRLTLIPWDLDSTLLHPGPRGDLRAWHELEEVKSQGHATSSQWLAWEPSHDALTRAIAIHARGRYQKVARELLDGPLAVDHMLSSIETWHDQIRAAVAHDPHLSGLWHWQWHLSKLRKQLHIIRTWMEDEVREWDDTLPASLR